MILQHTFFSKNTLKFHMKSNVSLNVQLHHTYISRFKQRGVVLFLALIALVVMSLAAVALIRSVDTNSVIAGNLAFKQAATASADAGVEAAINWLNANNSGGSLDSSVFSVGYTANITNDYVGTPGAEAYWNSLVASGVCNLPMVGGVCTASPGTVDAAGNLVAFMIQRMCRSAGSKAAAAGCSSATSSGGGGSAEDGSDPFSVSTTIYYRVLVRVTGPRNTTSYVQSVLAL